MWEDWRLLKKLKRGDLSALRRIYLKYKDDLLRVALSLLKDHAAAEDCLHDVFVLFAGQVAILEVRTSLKSYLAASIANRARDHLRKKANRLIPLPDGLDPAEETRDPATSLTASEESNQLLAALSELPHIQQEVICLHHQGEMTFKQIAEFQDVSINTIQSRYRYGLEKLRSRLSYAGVEL
jgi:RNA polymerase sigma-70 factor, ECF subfamily